MTYLLTDVCVITLLLKENVFTDFSIFLLHFQAEAIVFSYIFLTSASKKKSIFILCLFRISFFHLLSVAFDKGIIPRRDNMWGILNCHTTLAGIGVNTVKSRN